MEFYCSIDPGRKPKNACNDKKNKKCHSYSFLVLDNFSSANPA